MRKEETKAITILAYSEDIHKAGGIDAFKKKLTQEVKKDLRELHDYVGGIRLELKFNFLAQGIDCVFFIKKSVKKNSKRRYEIG